MPISPSDLPWWGWLLIAAVAGIIGSIGMSVVNAWRLHSPPPIRFFVGWIAAAVGLWIALLTAGIGIASLPHFWSLTVLAGLLVFAIGGLVSLSHQVMHLGDELDELRSDLKGRVPADVEGKLDAILERLESLEKPD
jgi:hypothetical protein